VFPRTVRGMTSLPLFSLSLSLLATSLYVFCLGRDFSPLLLLSLCLLAPLSLYVVCAGHDFSPLLLLSLCPSAPSLSMVRHLP
jgi:hypothetical protein